VLYAHKLQRVGVGQGHQELLVVTLNIEHVSCIFSSPGRLVSSLIRAQRTTFKNKTTRGATDTRKMTTTFQETPLATILRDLRSIAQITQKEHDRFRGGHIAVEDAVETCTELCTDDRVSYIEWLRGEAVNMNQRAEVVAVHVDNALRILLDYERPVDTSSRSPPTSHTGTILLEKDICALQDIFTSLVDIAAASPMAHVTLVNDAVKLRVLIHSVHDKDKGTADVALRTLSRAFSDLHNPLCSVFRDSASALERVVKVCATSPAVSQVKVMLRAGATFQNALHNEAGQESCALLELLLLPPFHKHWERAGTILTRFAQVDNTAFLKRVLQTFPQFVRTVMDRLSFTESIESKPWTSATANFVCWMVTQPWFEEQCRTSENFPHWIRILFCKAVRCHKLSAMDTLHDCFTEYIECVATSSAILDACRVVSPLSAEVLTRLLSWHFDPSAHNNKALFSCVDCNNIVCTRILLQDARVNPLEGLILKEGSIPLLQLAAEQNEVEIVDQLLQHEGVQNTIAIISAAMEGSMKFTTLEKAVVTAYAKDQGPLLDLLLTNPHAHAFLFESHQLPLRKALACNDSFLVQRIVTKPHFQLQREDKALLLKQVKSSIDKCKEKALIALLDSQSCVELLTHSSVLHSLTQTALFARDPRHFGETCTLDLFMKKLEAKRLTRVAARVAAGAGSTVASSDTGKRTHTGVLKR
jgi:hypothetical protein